MERIGIIYLLRIKCPDGDKLLVGQTRNKLNQRIRTYKYSLKTGKKANPKLLNYYNKYGWKAISFEILEYCLIEILDERERFYIKQYNTFSREGLNLTSGGESKKNISQETKDKIGKIHKGKIISEEQRSLLKIARVGRKPALGLIHSNNTRELLGKRISKDGLIRLINIITKEVVQGYNKTILSEKIGIYRKSINKLVKNKNKIIKNWKFYNI